MRRPGLQVHRFLTIAVALLLPSAPARDAIRSVTILHTNDLHARLLPSDRGDGGFAQMAAAIRRERENCSSCLLLNAGDLVQGTPVSTIFRGVPVYEIANLFGFDAATLGNHEFDYGWQTTTRFLKLARYPTVTANIVDESGKLLAQKAVRNSENQRRTGWRDRRPHGGSVPLNHGHNARAVAGAAAG